MVPKDKAVNSPINKHIEKTTFCLDEAPVAKEYMDVVRANDLSDT